MKVLVVGNGAREHAIAWKLSQSPRLSQLFCAPGNPGMAKLGTNVDLSPTNPIQLALWAAENGIDLTVVGPEAPLAVGLVNVFQERGLKVFGPVKEAARLEWSKSFAKEILLKAGVRTAHGDVFTSFESAKAHVLKHGAPIVIKADGLAAGKGVVVAQTVEEAVSALEEFMLSKSLGEAAQSIVIEECLEGREASVMALIDGEAILPLVVSQDYKRLLDKDQGPNTGGMGAISPTPVLADQEVGRMIGDIFLPTVRELWSRGIKYTGFLYAGVMVDRSGVARVLEFNCRLGDPETQVLMMRMQSDLLSVLHAAVNGNLQNVELHWKTKAAACVVAASKGYPRTVEDGKPIAGLDSVAGEDLMVFQAGTAMDAAHPGSVISRGGRVLTVAALGDTVSDASRRAYSALESIRFDGMQFRRDIGA